MPLPGFWGPAHNGGHILFPLSEEEEGDRRAGAHESARRGETGWLEGAERELVEAFLEWPGAPKALFGRPLDQLRKAAVACNGNLEEMKQLASSPGEPRNWRERIELVFQAAHGVRAASPCPPEVPDPRGVFLPGTGWVKPQVTQ